MKERPILFSTPMVQAILAGRKTQTRRTLNPQLSFHKFEFTGIDAGYSAMTPKGYVEFRGYSESADCNREYAHFCIKPKYGERNDRLWVRETWAKLGYSIKGSAEPLYIYKADNLNTIPNKWTPSIHMPRVASRITLEITNLRVERLLDISEQDAIAEGMFYTDHGMNCWHFMESEGVIKYNPDKCFAPKEHHNQRAGWSYKATTSSDDCLNSAKYAYLNLWDKINGKDSHTHNPWVWVIEFERLKNEQFI